MPVPVEPPPSDRWQPFTPGQLHNRLRGTSSGWYVVGGWALDLWHGHATREHEDLEFCILRDHFDAFRAALKDCDLFCADSGQVWRLLEGRDPPGEVHQFWGLDRRVGAWRFDMMIEPGTEATWRYKRDPSLGLPRDQAVRVSPAGIPYLAPAVVLLFKAKAARPKDDLDLRNALPKLPPADRQWLTEQIERLHPGHRWLALC